MLDLMPGVKHFFAIQRFAFNDLSIDVTSAECKLRRPFLIWLIFLCHIIFVLTVSQYCWTESADFNEFLEGIPVILTIAVNTMKFLVFLKNRKDVAMLVHKIWMLSIEAKTDELAIIAEENAKDFILSLCYLVSGFVCGGIVLLVPLCITLVVYLRTNQLHFYFIVKTSYPFDQAQPFNYFVTSCIQLGCVYFVVHVTVAIDTLYLWLSLNSAAQFRIIKLTLKKLALIHQDGKMYNGIQRCIKRHQRALRITDEIDKCFRVIVFTEVFANRVILCLVVYQIGHSGGHLKMLPYLISYITSIMVRLIIYCYGGQRIQDESQSVADFVYETFPWHSISTRSKKLLVIFMMRAQKCCNLSAFFFIANFRLFLWIVQTNYSYLSLLSTLEEKNISVT